MNYTGEKFSQTEAQAIMAQARAHLRWRPETQRRDGESTQRRDRADRIVTKTIDNAVIPTSTSEPLPAQDSTTASWVEWIDARIDAAIAAAIDDLTPALIKMFDNAHDRVQEALDARDAKIQAVRDEIEVKIGLGRKLARAKAEIEQLRERAPSYESELAALRGQIEKQQKIILRLRGEASHLAYRQQQLDSEQQRNKREISVTAVKVTSIGSTTREILESLRQDGYDWLGEVPTLPARPGLVS